MTNNAEITRDELIELVEYIRGARVQDARFRSLIGKYPLGEAEAMPTRDVDGNEVVDQYVQPGDNPLPADAPERESGEPDDVEPKDTDKKLMKRATNQK